MTDDLLRWRLWVNNPTNPLFPPEPQEPEEPDTPPVPRWCADAQPLLEWGDVLVEHLIRDPDPKKLDWAKKELAERYFWAYKGAEKDHRAEYNLDGHPCLHQAYLSILEKLDKLRIATGVPQLEPPPVRIIDQTDTPPRRRGREVNGSVIGTAEDDFS